MPFRLERVGTAELDGLGHLTFPAVRALAQARHGDTVVAIVVQGDDAAAGLAIAVPGPDGQFELLSLHVAPFFRRLGLGRALLSAVEEHFGGSGYRLGVHFFSVPEQDQGNARFFMACGWSRPALARLVCATTVANALSTPWLIEAELPARYEVRGWHGLSAGERGTLAAALPSWGHDEIDPFLHEPGHDRETSVALCERRSGTVEGWVITHRIDETGLRWTCSFLRPELQRLGLMRALWLAVVHRQARRPELTDFSFTVPVTEPRMARFALRRMRPWLSRLAYGCTTMKKVA
jgi:ribosomal protein S18 acetylase RimI-like enzyme